MSKKEKLIDEGLRVDLISTAFFDGNLEIPHINGPEEYVIPNGMVPFFIRERSLKLGFDDFVCFYENDINFRELICNTENYIEDLKRF